MTTQSLAFSRSLRLGVVLAFAALTMFVPGSVAQTPEAEGGMEGPHPVHIHSGTCAELGDVVVPLTDVASLEGEGSGPATGHVVKVSETTVDMPLQEIVDGGHAINVHKSAEEIDVYIACGNLGGVVGTNEDGRERLIIALAEQNESGHHGFVWLGGEGEQTEVVVVLVEPEEMSS